MYNYREVSMMGMLVMASTGAAVQTAWDSIRLCVSDGLLQQRRLMSPVCH